MELREGQEIQGQSGLTHSVQAIGVDDKTDRVIVVSAEHNPRIAALMRVDIQATMPRAKVLLTRPIAVDLAHAARTLFTTPTGDIDIQKVIEIGSLSAQGEKGGEALSSRYGPQLEAIMSNIARSGLPIRTHILSAFDQITELDWQNIGGGGPALSLQTALNALNRLTNIDNLAADRSQGICPFPTYELDGDDWELFLSGKRIDDVRARLQGLDVYQYFYPPTDTVALGLIDNGLGSEQLITEGLKIAEQEGHILTDNELVSGLTDVANIIGSFRDRGIVADVEYSAEITERGKAIRLGMKLRPKEALIARLVSKVSLSASLADILKMVGGGS
ncbi:hypothetical protein CPY51_30375 [Rhizobium tubonense]|uniref:Uncharacterized protein n=1 Tax=Rhizobium tubonense TaxID=484088 RepID=A0A2W4CRJ9_9HYPH|nr:hypothetical protein CPY51_30375 [Rhizobium tubonense]